MAVRCEHVRSRHVQTASTKWMSHSLIGRPMGTHASCARSVVLRAGTYQYVMSASVGPYKLHMSASNPEEGPWKRRHRSGSNLSSGAYDLPVV